MELEKLSISSVPLHHRHLGPHHRHDLGVELQVLSAKWVQKCGVRIQDIRGNSRRTWLPFPPFASWGLPVHELWWYSSWLALQIVELLKKYCQGEYNCCKTQVWPLVLLFLCRESARECFDDESWRHSSFSIDGPAFEAGSFRILPCSVMLGKSVVDDKSRWAILPSYSLLQTNFVDLILMVRTIVTLQIAACSAPPFPPFAQIQLWRGYSTSTLNYF